MNWFQFVFLREDSQETLRYSAAAGSCELISICIFTWGFTRSYSKILEDSSLWIDFNLYFYVRIHKRRQGSGNVGFVVNWFQFVFLREDSQESGSLEDSGSSCELISICIFTWGFTRAFTTLRLSNRLWIDFNLYFYVRIHK